MRLDNKRRMGGGPLHKRSRPPVFYGEEYMLQYEIYFILKNAECWLFMIILILQLQANQAKMSIDFLYLYIHIYIGVFAFMYICIYGYTQTYACNTSPGILKTS